jgi:hypothetical protein
LDEFSDIIEEFEAWDADGRPVDLGTYAADFAAGREDKGVLVREQPDRHGALRAIRDYRPDVQGVPAPSTSIVDWARIAGVK